MQDNMKLKLFIIKLLIVLTLLLNCFLFFACSSKNSLQNEMSNVDIDFLSFAKDKNEDLSSINDIYENVEYVKYTDLDKYYEHSEIKGNDKVIYYEGNIEYYDKDDKLIKLDENVTKLISTTDGQIDNERINENGYLINGFGMLELNSGFYRFDNNYYYISGETHKVVKCSNATMSNAIRLSSRKIIDKNDERYIVYTDNEKKDKPVKNSISEINGEVYLTDELGKIVTDEGIHKVSNIYDNTFHLVFEGLDGKIKRYDDRYYNCYINKDGKVEVANVIDIDGNKYLSDLNGLLLKDNNIFTGAWCDEDMIYRGSDDLDNYTIKLIYNVINQKSIAYNHDYKFYNKNIATESNLIQEAYFTGVGYYKDIYTYKNDEIVKNKIVKDGPNKYYVGKDGKLINDTIVRDYKFEVLLDKRGRVVNDQWIVDKQYYDNEKLNNDRAPYILSYDIDRELIKPYVGYYILPTGEIMKDDVYIESVILDEKGNLATYFKVKNGEFDIKYDTNLYFLNSYKEDHPEYNYEEYDEGFFTYMHRFTDATRTVRIENDDIDMQLKYRNKVSDIIDEKYGNIFSNIVYFGKYYSHDVDGEILEPIEWDILEKKDGMALLITRNSIEYMPYDINGNNDWDKSSIRKWLNNDFLNIAFNDDEKMRILSDSLDEKREGTNDKIFLLSAKEYEKYSKKNNNVIIDMYVPATKYLTNNLDTLSYFEIVTRFWFRNTIENSKEEYKYNYNETFYMGTTLGKKSDEKCCVRPAIWVKYDD